jgi:hypothetical protein
VYSGFETLLPALSLDHQRAIITLNRRTNISNDSVPHAGAHLALLVWAGKLNALGGKLTYGLGLRTGAPRAIRATDYMFACILENSSVVSETQCEQQLLGCQMQREKTPVADNLHARIVWALVPPSPLWHPLPIGGVVSTQYMLKTANRTYPRVDRAPVSIHVPQCFPRGQISDPKLTSELGLGRT